MVVSSANCYVDPRRGVAFFDGITIETDRITDPRYNRVLPILEEQQILMCRQMRPLLERLQRRHREGALVLDIGTGSGVFAIWAAKHGCRVIAIDISKRALRMAKANAKKNDINSCPDPRQLQKREICFLHEKFGEQFLEVIQQKFQLLLEQQFHLVLLSPPNTPTCPNFDLALHAIGENSEVGENGQGCFENQINFVPRVLRQNGTCIGIQMTPVLRKKIQAIETLQTAFTQNCTISYFPIIQPHKEIFTQQFLEEQYQTFLARPENNRAAHLFYQEGDRGLDSLTLEAYIDRVSTQYPKFTLIYYELTKTAAKKKRATLSLIKPSKLQTHHKRSWKDRIWFHQKIVEYSAQRSRFPTPSLFMSDFPRHLIYSARHCSPGSKPNPNRNWQTSVLQIVNDLIEWQHRQNNGQFRFDCILIEALPIHDTPEGDGSRNIDDESKIWLRNPDGRGFLKLRGCARRLLRQWHLNAFCQQKAGMSTFLHPAFTGIGTSTRWGNVTYSTLSEDWDSNTHYPEKIEQQYRSMFEKYGDIKALKKYIDAEKRELDFDKNNLYAWIKLKAFDVSSCQRYYRKISKQQRFPKLILPQYQALSEQWDTLLQSEGNIVKALLKSDIPKIRHLLMQLFREDLDMCHRTMHQSMHQACQVFFEKYNFPTVKSSMLFGIPLLIQKPQSDCFRSELETLPETYRGGIWVYAATSQDWTIEHERYLYKIARFTTLLYMEQYALEAMTKQEEMGEDNRSKMLGHEVKHVASAMSKTWIPPIDNLFDIKLSKQEQSTDGKIGQIEIWDRRFLEPELKTSLGIAPFRSLIESAGRLINFWCLLDNPADVPFADKAPPDFTTFVWECWKCAVDAVTMHAFARESPNSTERILNLQRIREAIASIHNYPRIEEEENALIRLMWSAQHQSSQSTVWLARVLVALFTNCVKYSDPMQDVNVKLVADKDPCFYRIEIEDTYKSDAQTEMQVIEQLVRGNFGDVASEAWDYLNKGKQKLEYLDRSPPLSTREVVQTCLARLEGEMEWPETTAKSREKFTVKIRFKYKDLEAQ